MTDPKKPKTSNPIEDAIGERAKPEMRLSQKDLKKVASDIKAKMIEMGAEEIPNLSLDPSKIPDEPSQSEMLNLEELNRMTEERLQDNDPEELLQETYPEIPNPTGPESKIKEKTLVSKPDLQPVTETSSPESQPPQIKNEPWTCEFCGEFIPVGAGPSHNCDRMKQLDAEAMADTRGAPQGGETLQMNCKHCVPAEEKELTALKDYILKDGFVVSAVAMHIALLCSEPLVTPSTTTWDFKGRANVPELVFNVLKTPGYLEGIWPSLKVVMGSNKGNSAWCAGIATTIAFFDVIRILPVMKG